MYIKEDEIVGYNFTDPHTGDGEHVCSECATKEEADEATADQILTGREMESEGERFFCDRCKERIR